MLLPHSHAGASRRDPPSCGALATHPTWLSPLFRVMLELAVQIGEDTWIITRRDGHIMLTQTEISSLALTFDAAVRRMNRQFAQLG
jgi:hypothetical protein